MLRGHRSIYISLFPENNLSLVPNLPAERRGRSESLIVRRNILLLSRYYYYVKIRNVSYPNALDALEEELFLSRKTIQNILMDNSDILKELQVSKPTSKYLKDKFPYLIWEQPFTPPRR